MRQFIGVAMLYHLEKVIAQVERVCRLLQQGMDIAGQQIGFFEQMIYSFPISFEIWGLIKHYDKHQHPKIACRIRIYQLCTQRAINDFPFKQRGYLL